MGVTIPPFIMEHIHEYRAREISEALSTVVAEGNHHSVVVPPPFLVMTNKTGLNRVRSIESAYPTQTKDLDPSLVVPPLVVEAWNTSTASPVTDALAAVVAGGNHHYLLMPPALLMGLGGASGSRRDSEMGEVFPTQTGTRQFGLAVPPFLTSYYGTDSSRTLDEPVGTVTTLDRHALVSPETETIRVEDCGFRMLQPHEIQNAMAFPGSYKVLGNSRDKVKQLGNAVTPPIMQMLIERCLATFN
jgi:DNA (cytosine-5)-methyltransferase 1